MRKVISTLLVVCAFVLTATAQNRTVIGKVLDVNGYPLNNVSVTIKGSATGTSTDATGAYSLIIKPGDKALVFSSVGFEPVEINIGNKGLINVSLQAADKKLEEVVVVGYGVQQKKAFTGSASKVDVKEFAQLVTPSIDKQLSGRASGVNVVNSSGTVNAPARIRIRGLGSYSQNLNPLVVVDGVPMTTGNLALIGNSNALGDINPSDIETIDVLKDGSATAIYGSAAANGIIQITTKKGSRGRSLVSYDVTLGLANPQTTFDMLNANQFVTIANEKLVNSGTLPAARLDSIGTNTDWQKNIFASNTFTQNHNLSVSGGTNRSTYFLSFNYSSNQGIVKSNQNRSFRLRANIEHEASKWLKVGNNLLLSRQKDNDQNNGTNALSGSIVGALRALPNVAIYNPANPTGYNIQPYPANVLGQGNNLRPIDDGYTNIMFVLDNNRYESDKYRIFNISYVEISPFKGFKYRTQLGIDYFNDNSLQILDGRHGDGFSTTVPGYIYNGQQNFLSTDIQNYINYTYATRGHSFYLTVGHQLSQTKSRFFSASGNNISDPFFLKENIITNTVGGTQTVGGNYLEGASESFFGRLNYDYKGKYFVQGSLRRDGQNGLAPGKKYQTFPGLSFGWRPIQEKFWGKSKFLSRTFTDFKVKGSYAVVGNPISGFPYLTTYGARPYGNLGGSAASLIGNPELTGERSIKYDIGLDVGLFNRATFALDLFKNDINEQILNVPQPYSAGIPGNQIAQNIGKIQNKGIELSLDVDLVKTKDFTWNLNTNYSYISNELKSLYSLGGIPVTELITTNYNINRVGEALNAIYGYRFAGVNSGNGNPVYYNAAGQLVQRNIGANGGYFFANSLSDPTLGAPTSLATTDKVILGSALPKYYGAFTNTFSYKGLSLEVMFRFQGGNKIMNITRQEILLNQKFANNGTEILNRWTTPGQITDVPKLWYGLDANANQNGEAISRFVEDGDFLKLQNIVLSYQMNPEKLRSASGNSVKSLRFFVQVQNVATWTKYKGIDPEAYSELGQDNSLSPQVRTISTGFNIGF